MHQDCDDPFFTTKAKGIGLGLPVCKRIVEAHKRYISFETEVEKGTTFTLTFPTQARRHD
jgi:signal transduction histidine kinase